MKDKYFLYKYYKNFNKLIDQALIENIHNILEVKKLLIKVKK